MSESEGHKDFEAALSRLGAGAAPSLELFRDGIIIKDHVCRLTLGKFALLHIAGNRLFDARAGKAAVTTYDVFEALYMLADEHLDEIVWMADDKPALAKAVCRFKDTFSRRTAAEAVDTVCAWLQRLLDALPQNKEARADDSASTMKAAWWVQTADLIFSEYSWSEHYVLWLLPMPRALRYVEAICARKGGTGMVDDISPDIMDALDKAEALRDGQSET